MPESLGHEETPAPGPSGDPMSRFPGWVFRQGSEPDPRFTLANERTFLAWIRTSLALIAGGVALEALNLPLQPVLGLIASIVLLLLGLAVPVLAWITWASSERAMRTKLPLPASGLSAVLAVGVTAVAILVTVGALLR
jgi:putative membrane protein